MLHRWRFFKKIEISNAGAFSKRFKGDQIAIFDVFGCFWGLILNAILEVLGVNFECVFEVLGANFECVLHYF